MLIWEEKDNFLCYYNIEELYLSISAARIFYILYNIIG